MSLKGFGNPGRFYRGNIHTHSTRSDGRLSPEEVCKFYRDNQYDFVMLSDHFLAEYDFPITDTRHCRDDGFTTLIGAELHAPATSHGELWHIVAAGLPLDFSPVSETESAYDLATRAKKSGAFVGLAHPSWSGISLEEARRMDMAHAIEIFNYGCAVETGFSDDTWLLDALSNEERRLSGFAVDDAHFKQRDTLGGWIMVKAPELDPDHLLRALKSGDFYSSEGPEITSLCVENNELAITSSPVNSIAVLGRGCRNLRKCGEFISRAGFPLEKFADHWFRVVVIDAKGRRAWSNPIWPEDLWLVSRQVV